MHIISNIITLTIWEATSDIQPQELPAEVCYGPNDIRSSYVGLHYESIGGEKKIIGATVENVYHPVKKVELSQNPFRRYNTSDIDIWLLP